MKFLKSHFALSRSQQNGIFVLVALIVIFQIILLVDFNTEKDIPEAENENIEVFRRQLDSLHKAAPVKKDTIFPFNPNYLTDFKGYQIGMSVAEIDRLLAYRKQNKWINSKEDFQKVTEVSDSLLKKLAPSFRFPEWVQKTQVERKEQPKTSPNSAISKSDLNLASAADLKAINGIGEVLSERIVKYRNSIGGFIDLIQLKDVYGLSPEVIQRITERFTLLSKPDVDIKNINQASEAELAEIPYFNFQMAKEIVRYRKLHENISSFEELAKINGFPYDKIDRIKLYLAVK